MFGNFDSFRRGFDFFSSRNVNRGRQEIKPQRAARDAKKKAPKPRTLRLESLENRELLSASAAELSTISDAACALESSVCPMENDDAAISPLELAATTVPGQSMRITGVQTTSKSAVVYWEGPNGVQVSTETGYYVSCYKGSKCVYYSERISDQNASSFSHEIPNLEPGTEYTIKVTHHYRKFDTSGGFGDYTVQTKATTQTSKLPAPTGISTNSTHCQELDVYWNRVDHAKGYTVKYSVSGQNRWSGPLYTTATSLKISGLKANTYYDIQVIANGDKTHYTDSDPGWGSGRTIAPTKLNPPVISGSATSANSIKITVKWDKVDYATEYLVAYAPEGGEFEFATTQDTRFTLEKLSSGKRLSPGKTYTFWVLARGDNGVTHYDSDYSAPLPITVLATPTVTNLNFDKHSISIRWDYNANASDYVVTWSPANRLGVTSAVVRDAGYTIGSLKANTEYSFTVVARGDGDNYFDSKESAKKTVRTLERDTLSTPTITTKSDANSITVNWGSVAHASGYRVSWSPANKLGVSSGISNGVDYTIADLEPGTKYNVTVRAKGDDDDYGDYKDSYPASTDVSTVDLPELNSPTNVRTSATATTISVSWDAVEGAKGYELWYKLNEARWFYQKVDVGKETSSRISGLSELTAYDFWICAKGDQLVSADSDFAQTSVTTPARVPLTWPDDSKLTATVVKPNTITVAWPAVDNASKYVVECRRYDASSKKWSNWSICCITKSGDETSAGIKTNAETKYRIRVKAIGEGDYKDSTYLTSSNIITPPKQLKAPSKPLRTGVEANSISVKWNKVANATGYVVLLKDSNGKLLSKTQSSENSCTITNKVKPNTTYKIEVKAKADGFTPSDPSPALTVTTPKPKLPAPGNLAKTGETAKSISIKWDKVANAKGYVAFLYDSNGKLLSKTESSTNSCTITKKVAAGTTYEIKVKAKVDDSTVSPFSDALIVTTPEPQAQLKAPGNLAKTGVTANSISVKWDKVANATGYDVFLYRDGKQVSKTESSTNSCTITKSVAANTPYKIKVRAKDGLTVSPLSDPLPVTTPKAQLKAPGNLAKTGVTANSISIKWGKVANATGYDVFLYRDGKQVSKTESSTNNCTITKSVAANTTYEIKVKAKADGFTASPLSDALPVSTAKAQLKTPGNLAKTDKTTNSISIKWDKVANATGYVVFLYQNGEQVSKTESSTNSCAITKNVAANTKYEIKVRAKADGFIASPLSDALIVTTPRKLNAPKIAEPTSTAKTITVKWDAVANAKGYTVAYAPKGSAESDFKKIKTDDKTTSYKITGLDAGKTYTVKVRALGDGGENYVASDFAVKNNVNTKAVVTLANPGNLVKTETTKTSISVKWNPVKNASGYIVRYAPQGSADSAFKKIETTDVQCTIKGLAAGTTYTVKVRAKGNGDQFAESGFTVKNFSSQLAAPQNVVITAYPKKLEIKWDSVKNASGYVVRYAPYGSADSDFKKIETTGAQCTITGLKPGTKYTVKIRAKGGDGFVASDFTVKNPTTKKANASSAILDNAFADFFHEGVFEDV